MGRLIGNENRRLGVKIIENLVVENVRIDPSTSGRDIKKTL